uniref:O-methyltransferase n=1 Tax=Panagrolaimus superbus TaxID=310955 RepID=A0A914YW50_9BILA
MKFCSFIFLICFIFLFNQINVEATASSGDKKIDKFVNRSKRSFLDYVTIGDLNWLHKILEMVFGDLYTELVENKEHNTLYTPPPPTPKTPFEAALKPWIKNITSSKYFTKQYPHPPHVSLPYPHIFTTPKSRRPTTTELPASSTENISPPSYHHKNVYERLSAQILKSNEKITEMPGFSSPAKAYYHTKAQTNSTSSPSRTLPPPLTWKATATPETVQLTTSLMNLYKPNRSLVVGVFTGLAVIGIASVTDSRGIVVGLEYPEYSHFWERVGMKIATRAGISNRIQIRSVESIDKALTKLAAYEPNAFDFIFMNEPKKVNSLDDYEHSVRLLRTNGMLVITDALENGAVISGEPNSDIKVVQAMNTRIKNDPRVHASLLPYGGGTWLCIKN